MGALPSQSTLLTALQLYKAGLLSRPVILRLFGITEDSMSDGRGKTKEEAEAIAAEEGLTAFFPTDYELMLDFDEPFATAVIKTQAFTSNHKTVKVLGYHGIVFTSQLYTMSKSGNTHMYIEMSKPLMAVERMVIQAALRSDPTREMYNMLRSRVENSSYQVALFETEEQAKLVKAWRKRRMIESYKNRIKNAKYATYQGPDF